MVVALAQIVESRPFAPLFDGLHLGCSQKCCLRFVFLDEALGLSLVEAEVGVHVSLGGF